MPMHGVQFYIKRMFTWSVNQHVAIFRYLLVGITVIILSLLFPRSNFRYDYERNRTWKYNNLYAPFDYALEKTKETLEADQKRVSQNFIPFYSRNNDVLSVHIQEFQENFIYKLTLLSGKDTSSVPLLRDSVLLKNKGTEILLGFYRKGILDLDDLHQQYNNTDSIQVLNFNVAQTHVISDYYTLEQLNDVLQTQLEKLKPRQADFLKPLLREHLHPNIMYDKNVSERFLNAALDRVSLTQGIVKKGDLVVGQGAIINDEVFTKLNSLRKNYFNQLNEDVNFNLINIGYFLLVSILITLFLVYLNLFRNETFNDYRQLGFIFLLIIGFLLLIKAVVALDNNMYLYIIPFAIIPIVLRTFFGNQMTLYVYVILLLLSNFMIPVGFEFLFLQFTVGLVAIFATVSTFYWSDFFLSVFWVMITYLTGFVALSFIQSGSLDSLDWQILLALILNSLLTLLAYPLIPLIERLFGFVSNTRLIELTHLQNPLLQELNEKAPGTFWHSYQVANLAEAAAGVIGSNALLVKVGALYHDIGKMEKPQYFIENQTGSFNPHDELSPLESVRIIVQHVTKGIEIAKKHRLPNVIIDFIRTHHGTTIIGTFMEKYRHIHPNDFIDEVEFRYPGPLPYSKETALVMIADSLDAASMSLSNPSEQDIENLVETIIQQKIDAGQFSNCDLSFKDLKNIKKVLKTQLKSKFHLRVKYR